MPVQHFKINFFIGIIKFTLAQLNLFSIYCYFYIPPFSRSKISAWIKPGWRFIRLAGCCFHLSSSRRRFLDVDEISSVSLWSLGHGGLFPGHPGTKYLSAIPKLPIQSDSAAICLFPNWFVRMLELCLGDHVTGWQTALYSVVAFCHTIDWGREFHYNSTKTTLAALIRACWRFYHSYESYIFGNIGSKSWTCNYSWDQDFCC